MIGAVLCLGDSITYGYPYGPEYSWVGLAAQKTKLAMYNLGLNGDTTGGMLARFVDYTSKCTRSVNGSGRQFNMNQNNFPDCVIITGGANDAWLGCGIEEVQRNISTMVDIAIAQSITPLLGVTVPLFFEAGEHFISREDAVRVSVILESYKDWMRDFAAAKAIKLVDFHKSLADSTNNRGQGRYYADNIHPNREGYRVMAEKAVAVLAGLSR